MRLSQAGFSAATEKHLVTQAKLAVILEGRVRVNKRFETLFLGLRNALYAREANNPMLTLDKGWHCFVVVRVTSKPSVIARA